MDVRRVVQVWVKDPSGPLRIGSGYLLTDSLVLTAAHVLGPLIAGSDADSLAGDDVRVQSHWAADRTVPAARVLRLGGDIVVLTVDRPFRHLLGPAPVWGTVGSEARVLPAVVLGYPELELQRRPQEGWAPEHGDLGPAVEKYRRDRQFDGEISSGTGFGDGTLTMHLAPRHFPKPGTGQPGMSVFMGLSGAAIFTDGHLIGVITQDPDPNHPTVLVGQRLDRVTRDMRIPAPTRPGSVTASTCEALFGPMIDVSKTAGARAVLKAHLRQARTILENIPEGGLRDRGPELMQMAVFSADPAAGYFVWHGDEWAGKSALLATFVAEPPANSDIVSFFINGNDAHARTADDYLISLTNQLEAYLEGPDQAVNVTVPGAAAGRYFDLLDRAAAVAHDNGRRLVLAVDALDEDDAFAPRPASGTSITELLPRNIPDLHVIVTTRPYEHVMKSARDERHPLRATMPVQLSRSQHASDIRDEAAREIRRAATESDRVARSVLAFLHVAEDELTAAELAELVNHLPGNDPTVTVTAIHTRLQSGLRRTVRRRIRAGEGVGGGVAVTRDVPWEWAHQTLPKTVMDEFGSTLINIHAETLHRWAEEHYRRGWSSDTPHFLESGYPRLLASTEHSIQLATYALDRGRRRWLFARRGAYDQTLSEIRQAAGLLARSGSPNLGTLVLLAFERDRLQERYEELPPGIPAVWAMLGNVHRAEVLAHSMPALSQTEALAAVVQILLDSGNFGEAERIASTILDGAWRASALAQVAAALAVNENIGEAERIAGGISDEDHRTDVLAQVAQALATVGKTGEAERIAGTITGEFRRLLTLAHVARSLAVAGETVEAERIAGEAGSVAGGITGDLHRARLLTEVARALAAVGNRGEAERIASEAGRIADSITDGFGRNWLLTEVARVLVTAGNIGEAEQIARIITEESDRVSVLDSIAGDLASDGNTVEAERIARTISSGFHRASALARLAARLAVVGKTGEAQRIASEAEHIAGEAELLIDSMDEFRLAMVLTEVARAHMAAGDMGEAERIAGTIGDESQRAVALAEIAGGFAAAHSSGEAARIIAEAESVAGMISDGSSRASTFTQVAGALADAGNTSAAEHIADTIDDKHYRASALARIARALADAGNNSEAERIAGETERIAGTIAGQLRRASALVGMTGALSAAGNTSVAEHIADTIADEHYRALALARIARALADAGNISEAERIAGEAVRIADPIIDASNRASVMASVAGAVAATGNIGEAERIAGTITDEFRRSLVLDGVAFVLVTAGNTSEAWRILGDAERIADTITNDYARLLALASVASTLAAAAKTSEAWRILSEAERIAKSINDEHTRTSALARVAAAFAAAGKTGEAERLAGTIHDEHRRTEALAKIALALARAGNTIDAERIASEAEHLAGTIHDEHSRTEALAKIALALGRAGNTNGAERIASEAEHLAGTIHDEHSRTEALAKIALALAEAGNIKDAERLSSLILATEMWPLAIRTLLNFPLVKAAVNPVDGWLTTELVMQLTSDEPIRPNLSRGHEGD
ncbi:trypsin-like peptidase domain-containing protein [Arthrobacter bambusae]|nr:trypsin-like peptidase domain-containing protein [Arthrobacter bambusae]